MLPYRMSVKLGLKVRRIRWCGYFPGSFSHVALNCLHLGVYYMQHDCVVQFAVCLRSFPSVVILAGPFLFAHLQ